MLMLVDKALTENCIWVVFQPVVDLVSGDIFSYEALVRCSVPGLQDAQTLIDRSVSEKMCGRLGRAIRKMASEGCPEQTLFLNIHPTEFDEGWLVRPDDAIFTHSNPIYLEITESIPLSRFQFYRSVLKELRFKGVCLAVDDLGSGYSNLKYIADLSPEIVKLDRRMIIGIATNRRLQILLKSTIRLCADLSAKTVVEGIESYEELAACIDAGADFGQGYFLAKPSTPPPQIERSALIVL
jgi:EAL domain-containing protein (putative c-di-GMP-specific phosphodiesterase class I)